MKSLLAFLRARFITKRIFGWQFYRSYLTAEAAKDNAPLLTGATAVIATSWTTLEAATVIGKHCGASTYWIPLSNRVAWRRGGAAFVSANRKKGRRAFVSLSRRLSPVISQVEDVYLIFKHPDSPPAGAMQAVGATQEQVAFVSTINDACNRLGSLPGKVLCLVDSAITPTGGISRLLRQLHKRIPGLEVILIPGRPDIAATKTVALQHIEAPSSVWPMEQYDERYSWITACRLLLQHRKASKTQGAALSVKQNSREATVYKRSPLSRLAKFERRLIDYFRKRNILILLKWYFSLRGFHSLEDEIRTFRTNLKKVAKGRRFDIVQSIDLISAPAGADLAESMEACHIVDVNEFAYLEPRVGWQFRTMSRRHFSRVYRQIQQALDLSKGVISNSVGGARLTLRKYGKKTLPVRNLRDPVQIQDAYPSIRSEFSIPEDATVIVHVCTISPAYKSDVAIRVLTFLPENFHLVFVGHGNSVDYLKKVHLLIGKLGLGKRVHFREEIADEQQYISYISTADVGLVILDIDSLFVRFNLPNRVCDLLAARLPVVSSYSYEVQHIFNETGTGVSIKSNDPEQFAKLILSQREKAVANRGEIVASAERAAAQYTWNSEISAYFKYVESLRAERPARAAAFVFQRGLVRNRRVLRFAEQYLKRGYKVTIFCGAMPPKEVRLAYSAIQFRHVPTRYHLEAK